MKLSDKDRKEIKLQLAEMGRKIANLQENLNVHNRRLDKLTNQLGAISNKIEYTKQANVNRSSKIQGISASILKLSNWLNEYPKKYLAHEFLLMIGEIKKEELEKLEKERYENSKICNELIRDKILLENEIETSNKEIEVAIRVLSSLKKEKIQTNQQAREVRDLLDRCDKDRLSKTYRAETIEDEYTNMNGELVIVVRYLVISTKQKDVYVCHKHYVNKNYDGKVGWYNINDGRLKKVSPYTESLITTLINKKSKVL